LKVKTIQIEGYRSLKKVEWQPGDLNIIIGPNGTGKSNLLRFLEMLSTAARGRLSRYVESAGGIKPLLWDGKAETISCKLEASVGKYDANKADICSEGLVYEFLLRHIGSGFDYRIEREQLNAANCNNWEGEEKQDIYLQREKKEGFIYNEDEQMMAMPEDGIVDDELLLAVAASPFARCRPISYFQKKLASWSIYHDLHIHQESRIRQPSVSRYETKVAPDGQNLVSVLHTLYTGSRDFKHSIDNALKAAFGSDYEELVFPPASDQRIQLRIRWGSLTQEQTAADMSDGTLYFLLLMTILNNPDPPALVAVDEPETGLHPSMLPIIAEHAVDLAQRAQLIFTTHSSQFLDAFHENRPVTTIAGWQDGESKLRVLKGDDLEYWLRSYTLGSLFVSGELEGI
jgi:predicted ATPase